MSEESTPNSAIILYQTEDGRTRVQCRFEDETVWLTQKLMAELFQIGVGTVNHHLKAIFSEGELQAGATIRCYRIVQNEGARQINREVEHYNLDAILAVGFRVRSHRGTQFRQWATARLGEYLLKGFTMDDERLKNPPGKGQKDYFDEQLERIYHLAPQGMAGFVLANGSLSSKQSGEGEIRKKLLEADLEDCMVALHGRPFFSTQILVCLWFFEKVETRRLNVWHSKLLRFDITLLWPRHFQTSN